jgi:hypothetical protein
MSSSLNFSIFPKSLYIHFQIGLTVPQKLTVLVCKTSCMSREEKKMPMYTSYQTFWISVECHVTVAWTTNIEEVECFMPLPKHMIYIPWNSGFHISLPTTQCHNSFATLTATLHASKLQQVYSIFWELITHHILHLRIPAAESQSL